MQTDPKLFARHGISTRKEQVQNVEGSGTEVENFKKTTRDLKDFSHKMDGVLDKFVRSDKNWFYKP